jgi:phosphatidylglycerophosphatase A
MGFSADTEPRVHAGPPLRTGLRLRLARWLATWFGCGLSPRAPGTVGSLGAVPLHLALSATPASVHVAAAILLACAGVWAAQKYALDCGEVDPQRVVIDEVAGTLIAMGMVRTAPFGVQCLALVAFRALDIYKPGPIRRLEHVQPLGAGIMLDDVLAGVLAGALTWLGWALL